MYSDEIYLCLYWYFLMLKTIREFIDVLVDYLYVFRQTPEQKENCLELIRALRSGKYEKISGHLHNTDTNQFCVMGLACELSNLGSWRKFSHRHDYSEYVIPNTDDQVHVCIVPHKVSYDHYGFTDEFRSRLVTLNDFGRSFEEIADEIEKYMRKH